MSALLALGAAILFGAADFSGGYATRRLPLLSVTLLSNAIGVVMGIALVAIVGGSWSADSVGWGVGGGLFGLAGLLLLYQGLAIGPNRLVSPISAVLAAAVPVGAGLALGERPDAATAAGLVLVVPAIWLVAGGDHHLGGLDRRTIGLSVGAGLGFGLFFTCLAQTPDDAGAVPLLAARILSTTLLAAAVLVRRPQVPVGAAASLPLLAGFLDMSANGLFLWATRDGALTVVAALVNLFPVTTILLAIAVLKERLTPAQAIGLGLAVTSAALLG